jgi:hypothetical protein
VELRATRWQVVIGLAAAGWVLWANEAVAQPASGRAATTGAATAEDEDPDAGTKRPASPDWRSGHVLLQGRLGFSQPYGSVASGLPASRVVSGGPAFGANLGLGLSRVTVLEASGAYATLPAAAGCNGCSGKSLDLGLGFAYHIAQGIAFDPWISYGVGYRMATFSGATGTARGPQTFPDAPFRGLDIARIALGGDFYPVPAFGLGAFLELDAGTYLSRPDDAFGATAYGFFQAGLRLSLDPVPRASRAAVAAPRRAVAAHEAAWRR